MLCRLCGLCSLQNRKIDIFGGEGGCFQDTQKLKFTAKCLGTFVAHCRDFYEVIVYDQSFNSQSLNCLALKNIGGNSNEVKYLGSPGKVGKCSFSFLTTCNNYCRNM